MTINEAKKINSIMINHGLFEIINPDNSKALKNISLSDMLESQKIIKNIPKEKNKNDDGTTSSKIYMSVDERLIAGLYVANNYEGGSLEEPTIIAKSNGQILLLINENELGDND